MFSDQLLDPSAWKLIYLFIFAITSWAILQLLTKNIVSRLAEGNPRGRRLKTLTSVIRTLISTIIVALVIFQTLSVMGFDLAPLLASAGIAGLAIGFGSQALVKDVISGFFLLAENQFDVGDEVEISGKKGIVEKITLRTIWLREKSGAINIIPAGTIALVTNFSRGKNISTDKEKLDKI